MSGPIPPIILKHHIFEPLEAFSRDWPKVCSFRQKLQTGLTPEQLVERMEANGICSPELGRLLLERWLRGTRFTEISERLQEIAEAIGEHGPYLQAWWVLGMTDDVQIRHLLLPDQVVLLLMTPHQDIDIVLAKARSGVDPTGPRLAAAYQGAIGQVLAGL